MFLNKWGEVTRGLTFRTEEWEWVEELARVLRRPKTAVIRKALRSYMLLLYLSEGRPYPQSAEGEKETIEKLVREVRSGRGE